MKFVIKQDILLENLYHASRAISPRNLIPILTGIKFDLKEEGLYLSASDTDISIQCFIEKEKIEKVIELGSIVIGGKYIVEIIKKLPNSNITIEVIDGNKMIVSTDNTEFNLNGINSNEFPNLDLSLTKEPTAVLPAFRNACWISVSFRRQTAAGAGDCMVCLPEMNCWVTSTVSLQKPDI